MKLKEIYDKFNELTMLKARKETLMARARAEALNEDEKREFDLIRNRITELDEIDV